MKEKAERLDLRDPKLIAQELQEEAKAQTSRELEQLDSTLEKRVGDRMHLNRQGVPEEALKTQEQVARDMKPAMDALSAYVRSIGPVPTDTQIQGANPFFQALNQLVADNPGVGEAAAQSLLGGINAEWKKSSLPFVLTFKDGAFIAESIAQTETKSEAIARLNGVLQATYDTLMMIMGRERQNAKSAAETRSSGGWFSGFKRSVTGYDPYALEISNANQKASTAQVVARDYVRPAMAENKTPAEKAMGIRAGRNVIRTLNTFDSQGAQERWALEEEAIQVSQRTAEVSIDVAGAVITLGGSALAKAALKKGVEVVATKVGTEVAKGTLREVVEEGAEELVKLGLKRGTRLVPSLAKGGAQAALSSLKGGAKEVVSEVVQDRVVDTVQDAIVDAGSGQPKA